jgi:hypothetical protein
MSSVAARHFLVTYEDEIIRLSNARFERLYSNPPKDNIEEFASQRMCWAEINIEIENRKSSKILRATYGYLHFNSDGCLNFNRFMKDLAVAMNAGTPNFFVDEEPHNVKNAQQEFVNRQRDHSVWWKPHTTLEWQTLDAAMDQFKYRRL